MSETHPMLIDVRNHHGFPATSWWAGVSDAEFRARWQQELPRIVESDFGQSNKIVLARDSEGRAAGVLAD